MKNKDLFHQIKEQAARDLPDVLARIDLNQIEIIPETAPIKRPHLSLQTILAYSLSAILVTIGLIWGLSLIDDNETPNYTPLASEAEIIGFQTLSSVSLLESLDFTTLAYKPLSYADIAAVSVIETEIETINAYMNMLEVILGNQDNLTYVQADSDDPLYQHLINFSGVDMTATAINYRFYYNATDSETHRSLVGKIVFVDREYPVAGEIVTIGDIAERSVFRVQIDEDNYVETRNLSTTERQRFTYHIFKNGVMTNNTDLRLVATENALQATIAYAVGTRQLMLQVEKTKAQNAFQVRYQVMDGEDETGEIDIDVEYDEETAAYSYRYTVRSSIAEAASEIRRERRQKAQGQPGGGDDDDDVPGNNDDPGGDDDPGNDDVPGNPDPPGRGNLLPITGGANL